MHAAVQPDRAIDDCEVKSDPDGKQRYLQLAVLHNPPDVGPPRPRTDLAHGHGTGYTKSCEGVSDRGADLNPCNLSIEVTRREALAKHALTFYLDHSSGTAHADLSLSNVSAIFFRFVDPNVNFLPPVFYTQDFKNTNTSLA
jgi:hypothetical protein